MPVLASKGSIKMEKLSGDAIHSGNGSFALVGKKQTRCSNTFRGTHHCASYRVSNRARILKGDEKEYHVVPAFVSFYSSSRDETSLGGL